MSKLLKRSILWLLTAVIFIALILFVGSSNYIDRAQIKREIHELRARRDYYMERIREDSIEIAKLRDDRYLEQYAREHFLMRRDSDVVFVLEDAF